MHSNFHRLLLHWLVPGACPLPFLWPVLLLLLLLFHAMPACALSLNSSEKTAFELAFDPGSAALSDEARRALRQLADKLNTQHTESVILTGHADAGEKAPQALGQQRARAVEQHLWHLGVNPWRIYMESKGSAQPRSSAEPARNRRVELYAASDRSALPPSLAGLRSMKQWMDGEVFRGSYHGDPGRAIPRPHAVLPQVEPALRPRFLRLMQLVFIRDQQDSSLATLRALDDGSQPEGDPLPPALFAQVFGTPYARAATRREAATIPAADPRRLAFAQRLWCDEALRNKPNIERMLAVLPAPEVLKNLANSEERAWISCALHSADALRWLRQQGVSLNVTRQPDGWTALHTAINDADETVFQALMAAGADPRATNHAGETPLHRIAHPDGPLLPYASQKLFWEQLLQAGADRDALDQRGQPARLYSQPLPPRNAHIADTWPPDLKRQVDALLALFNSRTIAPANEEIMALLNVDMQERQPRDYEIGSYAKIYEVRTSGTPANTPAAHRGTWLDYGPFYFVSTPSAQGMQTHRLTMPVAAAGFCLNPYELAIYTGASFSGGMPPLPPHGPAPRAPWHKAYAWDMFKSSPVDTYTAEHFHIRTLPVRDQRTRKVTDEGCVQTMGVTATFPN